jgi:hypothetical protein
MKKLFTLMIALGALAVANAQYSHDYPNGGYDNRDVTYGNHNSRPYAMDARNTYVFTPRERDMQIDRINADFDQRIRKVSRSWFAGGREKQFRIQQLDAQRRDEIRMVWERFRASNNVYDDRRMNRNTGRW